MPALMPAADIAVVALPRLDWRDRRVMTIPHGMTVAGMVEHAMPGLVGERSSVRVTIGDYDVPPSLWALARPKPGMAVVIRLIPTNDNLRPILATVVLVAAIAVSTLFAGPALAGALQLTGASASLATALTTLGLTTASSLLFNALVPLKAPGAPDAPKSIYSIQGFQNSYGPGAVIPDILGACRFAPAYAALPYTEIDVDGVQHIVALFNFGYGPITIDNIRLGDSPLSSYADVETEIRYGEPGDGPVTLFPQQVIEDSLEAEGATSTSGGGFFQSTTPDPQYRTTARDIAEISVDVLFPGGLIHGTGSRTVSYDFKYRSPPGSGAFTTVPGSPFSATGTTLSPIRKTHSWAVPARGQYEVEFTRVTAESDDVTISDKIVWSALRGFRPEYPIAFDKPLALLAIRIKATGQLSGVIANLNADVMRVCPDWDADSSAWITRATDNPASLYRYILQSNSNAFPNTDDQIDLEGLQSWHEYCVAQGLRYDRAHDFAASLWDALTDVAAAGRATPRHDGTKWGVVVDRPQDTVIGHLSPRNSWGFAGERTYANFPDGFRISFQDETNGYQGAEMVVPWPGLVGDVDVTEEISFPGVTNPTQIYREARKRMYELIHRLDTYTVNQDFEALDLARGDLCVLSHDVINRVQTSGRVKYVTGAAVVLDTLVTLEASTAYAIRFRLASGASLLKRILTVGPVETASLLLEVGDMPAAGDLALFGKTGSESLEVLVKSIEKGDGLTARLTLIDHAPQIEALVNADVVPDWSRRSGASA